MKLKFLLFASIFGLFQVIKAQIPNGSFEDWNGSNPLEWTTSNGLMQLGNPQAIFKSTNAHSGSFALEANVVHITNKPPGVFVPDYTGSLFIGKQILINSIQGFPCSYKPHQFNFWYMYNARNGDSATFLIAITRWNTSTSKRDTLSYGFFLITDSVGVYTKRINNLTLIDTLSTPDTAMIIISASTRFATKEGAKLLLDDLEFAGGTTGLSPIPALPVFSVYPNPVAQGELNLQVQNSKQLLHIRILDILGQTQLELQKPGEGVIHISTDQLKSGVYFIEAKNENGKFISKVIIE